MTKVRNSVFAITFIALAACGGGQPEEPAAAAEPEAAADMSADSATGGTAGDWSDVVPGLPREQHLPGGAYVCTAVTAQLQAGNQRKIAIGLEGVKNFESDSFFRKSIVKSRQVLLYPGSIVCESRCSG